MFPEKNMLRTGSDRKGEGSLLFLVAEVSSDRVFLSEYCCERVGHNQGFSFGHHKSCRTLLPPCLRNRCTKWKGRIKREVQNLRLGRGLIT